MFIPFWLAILLVFRTVPVRCWSKQWAWSGSVRVRATRLYLVLLFLFGIPVLVFSVLLVLKLQWFHSLYYVVVLSGFFSFVTHSAAHRIPVGSYTGRIHPPIDHEEHSRHYGRECVHLL